MTSRPPNPSKRPGSGQVLKANAATMAEHLRWCGLDGSGHWVTAMVYPGDHSTYMTQVNRKGEGAPERLAQALIDVNGAQSLVFRTLRFQRDPSGQPKFMDASSRAPLLADADETDGMVLFFDLDDDEAWGDTGSKAYREIATTFATRLYHRVKAGRLVATGSGNYQLHLRTQASSFEGLKAQCELEGLRLFDEVKATFPQSVWRNGVFPIKFDPAGFRPHQLKRLPGSLHASGRPVEIVEQEYEQAVWDVSGVEVPIVKQKHRAPRRTLENVDPIAYTDANLAPVRKAARAIWEGHDRRAEFRMGLTDYLVNDKGMPLEKVLQIIGYADQGNISRLYERSSHVATRITFGTVCKFGDPKAVRAFQIALNALTAEVVRLARGTPRDMRGLQVAAEDAGSKDLFKQVTRACVCGRKIGEVFGAETQDTLWAYRASCDRIYCSRCMAKRIEATKVLLEDETREVHFVRFPWNYTRSKVDRSILRMIPGSYETEEVLLGASVHRGYDSKGKPLTLLYSYDEGILDAGDSLEHVKAGATLHTLKGAEAVAFLLEAIETSHSGTWAGTADDVAARLADREKTRWVWNGTNAPRFATTTEGQEHVKGLAIKAREESGEVLEEVGGYETLAPDGVPLAISSHPVSIARYLELVQSYDLGFTPRVLSRADFVYERRSSQGLAARYG